jgi:hypothetical protein
VGEEFLQEMEPGHALNPLLVEELHEEDHCAAIGHGDIGTGHRIAVCCASDQIDRQPWSARDDDQAPALKSLIDELRSRCVGKLDAEDL